MGQRTISIGIGAFLRLQGVCGAVILASWAIFWAVGIPVDNIPDLFIYVLTQMNLTVALLHPLKFLYEKRGSRYHWLLHVASIFAVSGMVVVVSAVLVYYRHNWSSPLITFFRHSWKFPFIANLVFASAYETYKVTTRRLRNRNQELEQTIQIEAAERQSEVEELKQALEIQRGLLPMEIPQVPEFEIAGAWEPARVVGGDYFDVIRLSKTKVAVCIADVAGKGISAALLMANVQAAVRAFASDLTAPSELCRRVNSVLCTNIAPGKFVTLFYGILDSRQSTFTYANAGHPHPVAIGQHGRVARLKESGALAGVFPDATYSDAVAKLSGGDTLVLFTDGITEAARDNGDEFGEEGLIEAVLTQPLRNATNLQKDVLGSVKRFCNSRMADDATLIVITASQNAGARAEQPAESRQVIYSGAHND